MVLSSGKRQVKVNAEVYLQDAPHQWGDASHPDAQGAEEYTCKAEIQGIRSLELQDFTERLKYNVGA